MDEPVAVSQRTLNMSKLDRMRTVCAQRTKAGQPGTTTAAASHPHAVEVNIAKSPKPAHQAAAVIRHDLQDGHVQISAGAYGMASAADYDIVLMAIAALTEDADCWRQNKGPKPGPDFQAHVADVLNCCRYEYDGDDVIEPIVSALCRLTGTHVAFERTLQVRHRRLTISEGESLIAKMKVTENVATGGVELIKIRIADWMYREIIEGKTPRIQNIQRLLPKTENSAG